MQFRSAARATTAVVLLSVAAPSNAAARATSEHHKPVILAHRGASTRAPENTVAAIDQAARLGFDWVENDVQRTKDGELVVMHDTTLARTTNARRVFPGRAPWRVADFTLAEIERLDAGSWFGQRFKGERVPTLRNYMAAVEANHQSLLLELKNPELYPGIERQVLQQLRSEGWLDRDHVKDRLIIQSFSAAAVKKVHRLRPDVRTGFLGAPAVADLPEYAAFVDQINPDYKTLPRGYFRAVHSVKGPHGRPMKAYAWTIDDGSTAVAAARAGADGLISDKPDVVREALRRTA